MQVAKKWMVIVGELAGVLLAAGQGTRFGGNKGLALLPDGVPMAVRSALNLRQALPESICVIRPGDIELYDLLCEHDFEIVVAEDAAKGMSASIQAGISARPEAAGWMVALADMPLIKLETYLQLVAAFNANQQIIAPYFSLGDKKQRGHPMTFPARYEPDLMALCGDNGAKAVFLQYADVVQGVLVDDPGILQDFDTRQAFNRLFI